MEARRLEQRSNTIYHLYQTRFGVNVLPRSSACARRRPTRAPGARSAPTGTPLLAISRTALSYDDAPVELRESLVNTADHDYFSDLGKPGAA
jgi:GntR family transcriptional regulator